MITAITNYSAPKNLDVKNNSKKRAPAFTGLTDRFGKKVYNGFYRMEDLFPKEKTNNPTVGELPVFMKNRIKKAGHNIEQSTRDIFKTMVEVCDEIRSFEPNAYSTMNEIKNRRADSTVKKLDQVFRRNGILRPYDDIDIKYIDKGGKGSVFKLEGLRDISEYDEDEFVMKIFHTKSVQANTYHGCYPELNAATYWMKHLGYDTNRGKFFWGDVNEAYMINKYIDEDVRIAKKHPDPYFNGMKFTDENMLMKHNVCKDYCYDWGGGVVINQVVNSNKIVRRVMEKMRGTRDEEKLAKWGKIFLSDAKGSADSKYAGLAQSIQYLPPRHRVACFNSCMGKRGKFNDRSMGYALKYLPHDVAIKNYKILANSDEPVLKRILFNEKPLLSLKDEYRDNVKDDLIMFDSFSPQRIDKYFDADRLKEYDKIIKSSRLDSNLVH